MEGLSNLLKEVSEVIQKEETQKEEKQKRGEYFNIFSVLRLEAKEVRLHSAFLAELLNPEGSHGLGKQFLELFLNMVVRKSKEEPFDFETENAKVYVEHYIDVISEDKKSGGRIDLLIEDGKGNAIIIENKINAGDQEYQLLRYNNFAKDIYKNYKLLYLTKEGSGASEYSTDKENFEYLCISYRNDILPWLEQCEQTAVRHPLIRETIHQYIINLKEILNIMNENNKNQLLEIITSKEYVTIINDIYSQEHCWISKIFEKYIWNPLEVHLQKIDYKFNLDFCNEGRCIKLWKKYSIVIGTDKKNSWNDMYVGIKSEVELKESFGKLTCFDKEPNKSWPYGWIYLPRDLRNWEEYKGRENIINGKVKEWLCQKIDEIIQEIDNKHIDL